MGNYSELKTAISNTIKSNGNGEITGEVLQSTLLSMVNTIDKETLQDMVRSLDNSGYPLIMKNMLFSFSNGSGSYVGSDAWDCAFVRINSTGRIHISGAVPSFVLFFDSLEFKETYLFAGDSSLSRAIPAGSKLCVIDLKKSENPQGYDSFRVYQEGMSPSKSLANANSELASKVANILYPFASSTPVSSDRLNGFYSNAEGAVVSSSSHNCFKVNLSDFSNGAIISIKTALTGNMFTAVITDLNDKPLRTYALNTSEWTYHRDLSIVKVEGDGYLYVNAQASRVDQVQIKEIRKDVEYSPKMIQTFIKTSFRAYSRVGTGVILPYTYFNLDQGYLAFAEWHIVVAEVLNSEAITIEGPKPSFFGFYSSDEFIPENYLGRNSTGVVPEGAKFCLAMYSATVSLEDLKNIKIYQKGSLPSIDNLLTNTKYYEVPGGVEFAGFVYTDGSIRANGAFHYYEYTNLGASGVLTKRLQVRTEYPQGTGIPLVCYYDSDGNFISYEHNKTTGSSPQSFTEELHIPEGTDIIRVNSRISSEPGIFIVDSSEYYDIKALADSVKSLTKIMKVNIMSMEASSSKDLFYIRCPLNADKDLIVVYYQNDNTLISPKAAYVGPNSLDDTVLMTSAYLFSSHSDSTAPLFSMTQYWHLFAQHGYLIPTIPNSMGFTESLVGSYVTDQLNRTYQIGKVTESTLYLLPRITKKNGYDTREWQTPNSTGITAITDRAGVTYENTGSTTSYQIRPIMSHYNRQFLVDGSPVTEPGTYYCDSFVVSESQKGYDPATINSWFPEPSLHSAQVMANFTWSYQFVGPSCAVNTTIDIRRPAECASYGATQQQTFFDKGDYKAMFIIPKAAPRNGKRLDMPFNSASSSATSYAFYRTTASLKDINDPIDRLIAFLHNPADNTFGGGMAAGLSLVSGDTVKDKRNQNIPIAEDTNDAHYRLGSFSPSNTNKFYIAAVNTAPFANDNFHFPTTYFKEINYYTCYFDPQDGLQIFWYKDGNSFIIYVHSQKALAKQSLNLPKFMEGLKLKVVEKTEGISLLVDTIQNSKIFVNADAESNYIVLQTY